MAAVAQQIGSALGVAFATLALGMTQSFRHDEALALGDFRVALVACGMLMVASAVWLQRLPPDAGAAATAPR